MRKRRGFMIDGLNRGENFPSGLQGKLRQEREENGMRRKGEGKDEKTKN